MLVDMDDHRWLTPHEQRAWRAHLAAHRLLFLQLDRELQGSGLSLNDYEILVNLSEADEQRMRMSDLATSTLQSKSRLSHQITRMERKGMVRRESCESDRRGLFAVLTEEGWETMRTVAPHHVESVRRHFIDRMSETERAQLHGTLDPIAEKLRAQRGRF